MWPHCLYLYVANNVGFIGIAVFLWLFWTLMRMSRPRTDDLRHGDFVNSYLIVADIQLVVFLIDETKIEYLRNDNYQFQVWLMFALTPPPSRSPGAPGPAVCRRAAPGHRP